MTVIPAGTRVTAGGAGRRGDTGGVTTLDLLWCENAWCGEGYRPDDGWAGRCPSCLALADEHLAGRHTPEPASRRVGDGCPECRRDGSARRLDRRSA